MKGDYGATTFDKKNRATRVEINVKAHKGDRAELASTIKHELMHVKYPKMTEKQVYKKTAKTKISPEEQQRLLVKLRHKTLNYKIGAAKRKFKIRGNIEPGTLINNMNAQKTANNRDGLPTQPIERTAIMGAV